ncbi:hypothetical protein GCM10023075_59210 [Streptosporangium album]
MRSRGSGPLSDETTAVTRLSMPPTLGMRRSGHPERQVNSVLNFPGLGAGEAMAAAVAAALPAPAMSDEDCRFSPLCSFCASPPWSDTNRPQPYPVTRAELHRWHRLTVI